MLNSVIILFLLAGGDGVPAHKVPDLERIQRRMHAGDVELRRLRGELEGDIDRNRTGVVVIGRHNPELLMRWELMSHVEGTLNSDSHFARYAPRWAERGAAKLLGENYVERLRKVMAPLVDAQKEWSRLQAAMASLDGEALAAAQKEQSRITQAICPLRAQALAAARAEFGVEPFDRFLYEAVAPEVIIFGGDGKTPESTYELNRWVEEGCR